MIKFASSVIPVGQLLPKADRKRFVKIAGHANRLETINKLAAKFHNEYVDKMLETEEYAGQKNPQRMRDDKTGSGGQINLLQPFENLTPGWKEENLKAAEVAYDLVKENIDDIDNKMEEIAEKIHQAWSKRNSYSPLAKLSYAELSEDEKDKDRHQVDLAKELIDEYENPNAFGRSRIILDEPSSTGNNTMSNTMTEGRINDIIVNSTGSFMGKTPEETKREIKEQTGMDVSLDYIIKKQNRIKNKS